MIFQRKLGFLVESKSGRALQRALTPWWGRTHSPVTGSIGPWVVIARNALGGSVLGWVYLVSEQLNGGRLRAT